MLELKEKPSCCGKLMHFEKDVQSLTNNVTESCFYICWECGDFISIKHEQLDEEELLSYIDTYRG